MKFNFRIPTDIYFGSNIVYENKDVFCSLGSRAIIVTGRNSAKKSGALADLERALSETKIQYCIFDRIENNPSVKTIGNAAALAKDFKADMVIGVGGGSPLDAAKAVGVLTANPNMAVMDLFSGGFSAAVPIIAIPTTAGTGSEATPYSVLYVEEQSTKLSFSGKCTFPHSAMIDAQYTNSLSLYVTIDTAIDAFTHVFEGFLCNNATWLSDALALEAIRVFGECLPLLKDETKTSEIREKLMYVSFLGGLVITQTGVTIMHGMGYCFTCFKDVSHGRANAFLLPAYLDYVGKIAKTKIDKAMKEMGLSSAAEFLLRIYTLVGDAPNLTPVEAAMFTKKTLLQTKSIQNTCRLTGEDDIHSIWDQFVK